MFLHDTPDSEPTDANLSPNMISHYVSSFVMIVNCVAEEDFVSDDSTTIGGLFDNGFDGVDFELAITAFEATHRVTFIEDLWKCQFTEMEHLTLEAFIEKFIDTEPFDDPLYITNRLLDLRDSILDNLDEQEEEDQMN